MSIFITGSTGYLGSYVVTDLLRHNDERLLLLVRARDGEEALQRLWRSLQLHMDFVEFRQYMAERVEVCLGELTEPKLGLSLRAYEQATQATDSIIHIAASLNRRSEKSCLNVNLRGTLAMIKFALAAHKDHGLKRFSDVSTTAVAGERQSETIFEDSAIEWDRSDYDPYARSKKFCEHMVGELLTDIPHTIFRPSTVIGDSKRPLTTQFDMLRAFVFLARLPVIPLSPHARVDIVPADYVGHAIAAIHTSHDPKHGIYHLSAGTGSLTAREMVTQLKLSGKPIRGRLVERLSGPTGSLSNFLADTPRGWGVSKAASLLKVFWPYITFDTVFDNQRVIEEVGEIPVPCTEYMSELMDFGMSNGFAYPYLPWPEGQSVEVTLCPH